MNKFTFVTFFLFFYNIFGMNIEKKDNYFIEQKNKYQKNIDQLIKKYNIVNKNTRKLMIKSICIGLTLVGTREILEKLYKKPLNIKKRNYSHWDFSVI
jgi:hypothetical protein